MRTGGLRRHGVAEITPGLQLLDDMGWGGGGATQSHRIYKKRAYKCLDMGR